jgi:S1-C subfamily serine protease
VRHKPADSVTVRILRGNEEMDVTVTLGRRGDFVKREE